MTPGVLLRVLRARYGKKQKDIARELNVSAAYVSEWEREKSRMPIIYFLCLPRIFGVNLVVTQAGVRVEGAQDSESI